MKQIFTLLLLISSIFVFAQQVERQKVVVEVGTGTWCPSCPAVVSILHDFVEEGLEIAIVEYHNNDSYVNPAAVIRENYYDFPWFPTTYYDADHIGYDDWATPSVHRSYYENRLSIPSSFSVSIDAELNEDVLSGNVSLDKVADYSGQNLVLHIAITESNIPEEWQGLSELDYVERAMFPNGNGTAVDFSSGDNQIIEFSFDMDPSWVKENCEVTYFLQDNDTKEILQGDLIQVESLIVSNSEIVDNGQHTYFYPNPAQNTLYLSAKDPQEVKSISISDLLGNLLFEKKDYTSPINIEHFANGIYLLSYDENGEKKVTKIIKE